MKDSIKKIYIASNLVVICNITSKIWPKWKNDELELLKIDTLCERYCQKN